MRTVRHVRKPHAFWPTNMLPASHDTDYGGFMKCGACGRWVVRGMGDWWNWPADKLPATIWGARRV